MSLTLVNGQPATQIGLDDRGLNYGDGLFETLRVETRRALLLGRHLERLVDGMRRLKFNNIQLVIEQIESDLTHLLGQAETVSQVVKIVVTRGPGERGYRINDKAPATRVLSLSALPSWPNTWYRDGIEAYLCQTRLGLNPALAGLKHLNRLEQVLARSEWTDQYPEGLVRDLNDNLIEGTMSNLFIVQGDRLVTPLLDHCGVAGVARSVIIERAAAAGITVETARLQLSDLARCDGAFICNCVIGVVPLRRCGNIEIPLSELSEQAGQWLDEAHRCEH